MRALMTNAARIFFSMTILGALLSATTVRPMSVEDLTGAAEIVVHAHATAAWSQWNPEGTLIFTYTRFQVEETLKGTAGDVITVKQLGGSAGGYTQRVAGVRPWSLGESAILFLRSSEARDNTVVVVGLMQGDFRIHASASGEILANNGVPQTSHNDVSAFHPATGEIGAYTGSQLTLSDLKRRIHVAVTGEKETQ